MGRRAEGGEGISYCDEGKGWQRQPVRQAHIWEDKIMDDATMIEGCTGCIEAIKSARPLSADQSEYTTQHI